MIYLIFITNEHLSSVYNFKFFFSFFFECLVHSIFCFFFFSMNLRFCCCYRFFFCCCCFSLSSPVRWYEKQSQKKNTNDNIEKEKLAGDFFIYIYIYFISHFGCCAASFSCMLWKKKFSTQT